MAANYWLDFDENEKPLVLNSTRGQIIAQICNSDDFEAWAGHQIVCFLDPNISMRGKVVGGIGVRAPRIAPRPSTPPSPRPPTPKPPPTEAVAAEPELPPEEGDDVPF